MHLRLKDENHLEYSKDILKFHIPSRITDLQQAGRFVGLNFTPPTNVAFGSIAVNEENNIIVLNANHRFSDGGFVRFLMQRVAKKSYPKETPIWPKFTSDVFKDEIAAAPEMSSAFTDPELTRIRKIKPNNEIKLISRNTPTQEFYGIYHPDGKNYNFTDNVIQDKSNNQKNYMGEVEFGLHPDEFISYDKKKNAPSNLTEYLWLSQYFAASAYVGKPFNSFKIITENDLRRYLKHPDFLNCYHTASTCPHDPSISLDDKLSKIANTMRKDLLHLRDINAHFSNLKCKVEPSKIVPGIDFGVSGVGALPIRRPMIDAHFSILANATKVGDLSNYVGSLFIMSTSASDPKKPNNKIFTKIMYNPNIMNDRTINTYLNRIRYVMTKASFDQTVGEVFDGVMKVD